MKKLLALPALGAAAALTYGAAAALSVNQNGATLQVGEDVSVACAEYASIAAFMYDDASGLVDGVRIDITDDPTVNGSCDGQTLYVTPLAQDGTQLPVAQGTAAWSTGMIKLGYDSAARTDSKGAVSRYTVNFGNNGNGRVSANNLERVRIGIDQGPGVGPNIP